MKDDDGNVLEIETRGVRDRKGIYFKVKDVSEALNIKHLQTLIIDKNSSYTNNTDYKYFVCCKK